MLRRQIAPWRLRVVTEEACRRDALRGLPGAVVPNCRTDLLDRSLTDCGGEARAIAVRHASAALAPAAGDAALTGSAARSLDCAEVAIPKKIRSDATAAEDERDRYPVGARLDLDP